MGERVRNSIRIVVIKINETEKHNNEYGYIRNIKFWMTKMMKKKIIKNVKVCILNLYNISMK